MKFEIALIDDAPQDLNALRTALREACTARGDQAEIACYLNPGTALADAERGRLHANLVFVDVMMPEQSGTELIPALRDLLPQSCLFVLMSSNHGYIRAGYGVEAFDFLCKPILGPELREVLERAARKLELESAGAFSFRSDRAAEDAAANRVKATFGRLLFRFRQCGRFVAVSHRFRGIFRLFRVSHRCYNPL